MLWSTTRTISTIELCGVTALFGIFLKTKLQNLMRLGWTIKPLRKSGWKIRNDDKNNEKMRGKKREKLAGERVRKGNWSTAEKGNSVQQHEEKCLEKATVNDISQWQVNELWPLLENVALWQSTAIQDVILGLYSLLTQCTNIL